MRNQYKLQKIRPDGLNADNNLKTLFATFRPDAIIKIGRNGGLILNNGSVNNSSIFYDLKMTDLKTSLDIWNAKLQHSSMTSRLSRDQAIVEKLAKKLLSQMSNDAVIKTCMPSDLGNK